MREYGLTLLVAAAVTYLFTPLVRRFAIAVGAEHRGRARDVHTDPVPLLGGIAMYLGLAAGLLVASRLTHLSTVFTGTRVGSGLLLAGGVVVLMGFVDDRWGLGAITKLAGQVAAGVILVWSGAVVAWLPVPGGGTLVLTSDQQTLLTILVVVVTINAVNFIDGLDGLAAGIVGIGAAAFFLYYYTLTKRLGLDDQTDPAMASAILAGICLGFLPYNFHPARIFMGDTGSMLLGLLLAYEPISSLASLDPNTLTTPSAYSGGTVNRFPEILPLLVPAIIMLIPYADLLLAVVRRTRAGLSPFSADKKHLQHRLLAIGHSHRTSVLLMYLWAALFAGTVVLLSIMRTKLLILGIVTLGGVLVLLLASMPRLRWWNRQAQLGLAANLAGPVPSAAAPGSAAPGPAGPGSAGPGSAGPGAAGPGPAGSPVPSPVPVAAGASAPGRERGDAGFGQAGRGGAGYRDSRRGQAGTGWDARPAGEAWDGLAGSPRDARTAGSPPDGRTAGSPQDGRTAEQARPPAAAWDATPSGTGWDARPIGAPWDAGPAGAGWDAKQAGSGWDAGSATPSRNASARGASRGGGPTAGPSNGAPPTGGRPSHPADRGEPGQWYPGRAERVQPASGRTEPVHPDSGRTEPVHPDSGRTEPVHPDSGRWYAGRPDPGQRDNGWRDARTHDTDPHGASPQHAASPQPGPQDFDPPSPNPVQVQPPGPGPVRPANRDGDDNDEAEGESPLLPWRFR